MQESLSVMGYTTEHSKARGSAGLAWQNYVSLRTKHSSSFYDVIWDCHRSRSDRWSLAHGVSTRPCIVARILADWCDNVMAIDLNVRDTTGAARSCENESVTVEECRAEKLRAAVGRNSPYEEDLVIMT